MARQLLRQLFELDGQTALATGASSAQGRHFAGARVALAARRTDKLGAAVAEIAAAGGVSPCCASNAGLKRLTRALARERARFDIRVNSLAPGYIATELNRAFLASEAGASLRMRIPTRRFGLRGDLDAALRLLAGPGGSYINGAGIVVDGSHSCNSL
jgi:NAD(P)-dependent dehydrogenase (short-subunit alcohol dehydrogenase family)